ncbi:MAG: hypothetical protein V7631_1777 [Massilia sp.]|jgi:hypothetical protein
MRTSTLAGRLRRTRWKSSFLFLLMLPSGERGDRPGLPAMATPVAGTIAIQEQSAASTPRAPRYHLVRLGGTDAFVAARAAPVIAPIGVQGNPHVDNPLVFAAAFTDIDRRDAHLALWSWGDGSQAPASVHGKNGAGSVKGRHAYRKAGVYTVRLTVLDSSGKRATATRQVVVRSGGQVRDDRSFHAP